LSIFQDKSTTFVSISFEHISPIFAQNFLSLIIKEANSIKRSKDLIAASKALDFLKIEFGKTSFIEIKDSINKLIESQLEKQMLANINEEYSLSIIEPPFIPEVKAGPSRATICIVLTLLGAILSMIVVLSKNFLGEKN